MKYLLTFFAGVLVSVIVITLAETFVYIPHVNQDYNPNPSKDPPGSVLVGNFPYFYTPFSLESTIVTPLIYFVMDRWCGTRHWSVEIDKENGNGVPIASISGKCL